MSRPRLRVAVRDQMQMRCESLDQLLPPDHPVRGLWQFVADLDVSAFTAAIRAVAGSPGAPPFDPRTLIALWLQATLDGYGSARELADLCEYHLVYRWLCGDDPVNHHTLSDFRVQRADALDQLLTQSVAVLVDGGLAALTRVAQDGVRVRAHAGAASRRRAATLDTLLVEAGEQVRTLAARVADGDDGGAGGRRGTAARQRAAADRVERLTQAQAEMAKLVAANAGRAATPKNAGRATAAESLRVSTTDPEARTMRMPDGGYRPAFNVQFATATAGGAVVGVRVTNVGSDANELEPMVAQLAGRYGSAPAEVLADGGFANLAAVERLAGLGVAVFLPSKAKEPPAAGAPAGEPPKKKRKRTEGPGVRAWRERMASEEGRTAYRQRSATAEWANALARNRGLQQLPVRGVAKATAVATWFAVAHNVRVFLSRTP